MFSGEKASLPWFAVAVYDLIMGAEQLQKIMKLMQKGLIGSLQYFPKQYYTLLD
jgi:hypothetical protein